MLYYCTQPAMYYIVKGNKVAGTKNTIWLGKKNHRNKKHNLVREKQSQEQKTQFGQGKIDTGTKNTIWLGKNSRTKKQFGQGKIVAQKNHRNKTQFGQEKSHNVYIGNVLYMFSAS